MAQCCKNLVLLPKTQTMIVYRKNEIYARSNCGTINIVKSNVSRLMSISILGEEDIGSWGVSPREKTVKLANYQTAPTCKLCLSYGKLLSQDFGISSLMVFINWKQLIWNNLPLTHGLTRPCPFFSLLKAIISKFEDHTEVDERGHVSPRTS